jgi:hypothetical protein
MLKKLKESPQHWLNYSKIILFSFLFILNLYPMDTKNVETWHNRMYESYILVVKSCSMCNSFLTILT